jgi:hypothetical protein
MSSLETAEKRQNKDIHPRLMEFIAGFNAQFNPQTPTASTLVFELAHLAWKLEQIPQIEYEIELNSPLTLPEHFMQDKPTPLTRLWSLQLRLSTRFDSILRKLQSLATAEEPVQNEPKSDVDARPSAPPASKLQNKPTPHKTFLQNEPTPPLSTKPNRQLSLLKAINAVPLSAF